MSPRRLCHRRRREEVKEFDRPLRALRYTSFQLPTPSWIGTRERTISPLPENNALTPMHAMHYACVRPGFSRARPMGVSSNQRPIRVVHASRGLPNAIFNRNYDTSRVHTRAILSRAAYPLSPPGRRNKCRGSFTRFPRPPVLDPNTTDAVPVAVAALTHERMIPTARHTVKVEKRTKCQKVMYHMR